METIDSPLARAGTRAGLPGAPEVLVRMGVLEGTARLSAAVAESAVLARVRQILPAQEESIGTALARLAELASALADEPASLARRAELLAGAESLATALRRAARGLAGLEREIDRRVEAMTARAARILAAGGGEPGEPEIGGAAARREGSGLSQLVALLGAGAMARQDGAPPGRGEADGALGALVVLRDKRLPAWRRQLDRLASAIRDALNAVQDDPLARDLDGHAGADLLCGGGAADLAVALLSPRDLAAALGPDGLDGRNALALGRAATGALPGLGGTTAVAFLDAVDATIAERAEVLAETIACEPHGLVARWAAPGAAPRQPAPERREQVRGGQRCSS